MNKNKYLLTVVIFIIIYLTLNLTLGFMSSELIGSTEGLKLTGFNDYSFGKKILIGVLVAPLIETLLCQVLPIEAIALFEFKLKKLTSILSSGMAFSLIHIYSLQYMVVTFFLGMLLGYYYLHSKNHFKKGGLTAFLVHAATNFIIILLA